MAVNAMGALSGATDSSLGLSSATGTATAEATADRFLKLLVAQMQNQDPLNPMDNAQVTSQMAQINTVAGIDKLNGSVQSLSAQFLQSQALQSAALVGHEVLVPGDRLTVADGAGTGAFELPTPADEVSVQVVDAGGRLIDTVRLGKLPAGSHDFSWASGSATNESGLRFQVKASAGSGAAMKLVTATPMMRDTVESVSNTAKGLTLQTKYAGDVPFTAIKTIL